MKIYYQWIEWSYHHKASLEVYQKLLVKKEDIIWLNSFSEVFSEIKNWNIWILAVENSYAWSIHENFSHMISWEYSIIWEIYIEINHCLLANTQNIEDIKEAYSHYQALLQCQKYLKNKIIKPIDYIDTAMWAKFVKESWRNDIAAIWSDIAWEIYNLNVLDKNIQDQKWNKTRFFIIVLKSIYEENKGKFLIEKVWKIAIHFKTKDIPAALYKCLWAFATRFINLKKIESISSKKNHFEYIFWVEFEKNVSQEVIKNALDEVRFFCEDLKVLWDY